MPEKLLKMVKKSTVIEKKNKNSYWQDTIAKETETIKVTFHILANEQKAPNGYQYVYCQMIFNVKMKDFRRKICLMVGGLMSQMLGIIGYSRMVTRESVCIALTMAALNDLV